MLFVQKKKKAPRPDEAILRVERGNSTELTSFLFLVCLYFFLCFGRQSHHGSDLLILLTPETRRVQLSLVIIREPRRKIDWEMAFNNCSKVSERPTATPHHTQARRW